MKALRIILGCALAVVFSTWIASVSAAPKVAGPPAKTPWSNPAAPKVVYGTDNRIDVYEETDQLRRTWAASTCALVDEYQLSTNNNGDYLLDTVAYQVSGYPPCPGEPFANQPVAAFCTGFMVGPDLIATAGHCVDEPYLDTTRFVFGFDMEDSQTPVTTFAPSQVYTPVEIVGSSLTNDLDYAVVRVDRPITAPGAQVLELRRTGTIAIGAQVGIIGHPAGLPTKLAFGAESVVRDNAPAGYFVTNLDTYGGNSGSPVFNADTGLVEGILVRGDTDFVLESTCFVSNVLPVDGGRGEDVSKSTTFADLVPGGQGQLSLNKKAYQCSDTIEVTLFDLDLSGEGATSVTVSTLQGDQEAVILAEQTLPGTFAGAIDIQPGTITPGSGVIEAAQGHAIVVTYTDDNYNGSPGVVTVGATVDCTPPVVSNVAVTHVGGISATVSFETSEPAVGIVWVGDSCAALTDETRGEYTREHTITINDLEPLTTYAIRVGAEDAAGNEAALQPADECLSIETGDYVDPLTEPFLNLTSDLVGMSATFTPDGSAAGYSVCTTTRATFPSDPGCGTLLFLADDTYSEYVLPEGKRFTFFGIPYERVFIGSNGYITFGQGDDNYDPSLAAHFALPRISGYFSDMVPRDGGRLVAEEFDDRLAVTFDNVPDYYGDRHSFQMELFYDGAIRLTWLKLTQPYGVIGLSSGAGMPAEYKASDISGYDACGTFLPDAVCGDSTGFTCASAAAATLTANEWNGPGGGDALVIATFLFTLLAMSTPISRTRKARSKAGFVEDRPLHTSK